MPKKYTKHICNHHKSLTLYHHEKYRQYHDSKIIKLIRCIHDNEIHILRSCCNDYLSGYDNYIWIEFEQFEDSERFMKLVIFDLDDADDMRIRALTDNLSMKDRWYRSSTYKFIKNKSIAIHSIRFPISDCKFIIFILKHYYKLENEHVNLSDDKYMPSEDIINKDDEKKTIPNIIFDINVGFIDHYNKDTKKSREYIYSLYRKREIIHKQLLSKISDIFDDINSDITNQKIIINETSDHILHMIKKEVSSFIRSNHETIKVYSPHVLQYIDIDKSIAPLIKAIWDNGIQTTNSCEDNNPKNYIWIAFESSAEFNKFMTIILKDIEDKDINDKYDMIGSRTGQYGIKDGWYYDISFDTYDEEVFSDISVRFPQKDYEYVLKKLQNTPKFHRQFLFNF
jgi:hypothetical protein